MTQSSEYLLQNSVDALHQKQNIFLDERIEKDTETNLNKEITHLDG